MSLVRKHIFLTGFFCLVSLLNFAGEKSIKFGSGYKQIKHSSHKVLFHSGRYFNGGYSYLFGDAIKQKIQFQISNSNREIELDLPYVSASTGLNLFYDVNFRTIQTNKFENYLGLSIGNDFSLNFFPQIDTKNFLWESQAIGSISSLNSFSINKNQRIDLNFRIPFYSGIFFNRIDRLSSEVPNNMPATHYRGSIKKLLNANYELGYVVSKLGVKFGLYYQAEFNRIGQRVSRRVVSSAHSLSLRILYK